MDNFDLKKYLAENRLFNFRPKLPITDYVDIDQEELNQLYDRLKDEFEGNVGEFIEEYGQDFLSPNIEKISKYYGAKVLERDVRDDFFLADGLEFISSNERFEKWLDRNKQFYLAEGKLLKEDIKDKAISVLKSYEGEVKGVEGYIKYLRNTSDDISSSIQAIADDLDRDKPSSDSLRRDLEKLSLAEGKLNESINLSDYNEDAEKAIEVGLRVGSEFDVEDIMYYVHNNWMGGNITAEEAMKKVNKYLSPR